MRAEPKSSGSQNENERERAQRKRALERARLERTPNPLGRLLRHWRAVRGMSQLDLALAAEVSPRHVGFVEVGRAAPSREMVLRLCAALDVPAREQNALLEAAGFAAFHTETPLDAPAMAEMRWLLDLLLRQQEPHPAVVVDRSWNIVLRNDAAVRLSTWLFPDAGDVAPAKGPPNTMRLALHPSGLRAFALNWTEVAADLVDRLDRQARAPGASAELRALRDEVIGYPGVPAPGAAAIERAGKGPAILLPLHLRKDGVDLRLVSALTKIAASDDVTVQDLSVESLLPADAATADALRHLATRRG